MKPSRGRTVNVSLIVLLVLLMGVTAAAWVRDRSLPMEGLRASGRLLQSVWPELVVGFLLAGMVDVLFPAAMLTRWLGSEGLGRGIPAGWAIGLLLPGGPYLLFPVVAGLFAKGAAPGALIALISAKTLLSPVRALTYEAPLLGWPLTAARLLPALLVPPLLGLAGEALFRAFGGKGPPG
jgi:uncharacterized membrane protein YraQ (UPF0718 family)